MVLHGLHLRTGGQQVRQMSAPARRAEAPRLRPIERDLDPAAHAARCLGLGRPQRFDHPHHHADVNLGDGHRAECREGVSRECIFPLLTMFRVPPAGPIERRNVENSAKKIEAARTMTFQDCAAAYQGASDKQIGCFEPI